MRSLTAVSLLLIAACGSTPDHDPQDSPYLGLDTPAQVYARAGLKQDVLAGKYDEALAKAFATRHQNIRYRHALRFLEVLHETGRLEDAMSKGKTVSDAVEALTPGPYPDDPRNARQEEEFAYAALVLATAGREEVAKQTLSRYMNQPDLRVKISWEHCRWGHIAAEAATKLKSPQTAVEGWRRSVYGACGDHQYAYPRAITKVKELGDAGAAHELEARFAAVKKLEQEWQVERASRCMPNENCDAKAWAYGWKAQQAQSLGLPDLAIHFRAFQTAFARNETPDAGVTHSAGPSAAEERSRQTTEAMSAISQHARDLKQQNDAFKADQQAKRDRIAADNQRQRELAAAEDQRWQQAMENRRRQAQQPVAPSSAPVQSEPQQRRAVPSQQASAQAAPPPRQVAEGSTPRVESFFRNNIYYLRNTGTRRVQCQVSAMIASSGVGTQPGLQQSQKAVVLFPDSEEAPFNGPVGNPRFFGCRVI